MINNKQLNKLQSCQNKCIDMIMGTHADPNRYSLLGILKIRDLILLENQKFGYKLYHNLLPIRIMELSQSDQNGLKLEKTHHYNTRRKKILNKPKAYNKLYRSCIIYKGMDSIKTLKGETLNKKTMFAFTKLCKKNLFLSYK